MCSKKCLLCEDICVDAVVDIPVILVWGLDPWMEIRMVKDDIKHHP